MATAAPDDTTSGADPTVLLQSAVKMLDEANATNRKVRLSAGGTSPVNIDRLDEIFTTAAGTIKAQNAVTKGAQQLDAANSEMQAEIMRNAAKQQADTAAASGRVAEQQATGALQAQNKNIALSEGTNLDEVYKKAIDDINLASDRKNNLMDAAVSQNEKSKLMNVFSGDATFSEFLNATFVDTPRELELRAAVQDMKIKTESERLANITAAYTGSVDRNKSTAVNLTTASIADAATLASNKALQEATQYQIAALTTGADNLKRVVASSQHVQNVALGEAKIAVDIENSKRANARFDMAAGAQSDPEAFAKGVRLGGQFLGSSALANMSADAIKLYMNNPATKKLATQAYFVGMGLAGHAATDSSAPMPNLTGSAGESALLLESSRGTLPTGMGRSQRLLQNLAANTEYAMVNGVQGRALKPEERAALIDQRAAAYYQDNAGNIDDTESYGKPPLKTIPQLASMNTDPDVALFNKQVLTPLALANDTVPADLIVKAGLASGMDMNTQIKGLVAFAQSVKALNDATAQYQVVGLKPAQNIPYTAVLSREFTGRKQSVALDDEVSVRNYLTREMNVRASKDPIKSSAIFITPGH